MFEWIAERWAKYRGYCRHYWEMDGHVEKIEAGIKWNRVCAKCGIHQAISTCYGYAFLDKEWNS